MELFLSSSQKTMSSWSFIWGSCFLPIIIMACSHSSNFTSARTEVKMGKEGGFYEILSGDLDSVTMNNFENMLLDTTSYLSLDSIKTISFQESIIEGTLDVNIELNAGGARAFRKLTARNINKPLVFMVKGEVVSAPMVIAEIPYGSMQLSMHNSKDAESIYRYLTE